ncbi:glycine C-acetyltransferase [Opitutus terrae]|uniref:2-amino-3-ketobutyrate coenzyme A ligase n=1 Tax=Opitutus terrae (strain DSM 11246 / JCM 15787 / PB90-1) TaxID=452637 RepID=B1ZY54_OPITP|nr:glycine C-acetyltransferase [Opitutus terrae]ACB76203.1 2-amino-3-ketobutyrate coenzyme A ligase [Opitutus terrae PB90-1]
MTPAYREHLQGIAAEIESAGLTKRERVLASPQRPQATVEPNESVLNFCANNYLGLSNHPEVIRAAQAALDRWGYGLSSVRFICGTQQIHRELEEKLSGFLRTDATILYSSCFDANGGVFETLLGSEDAVISDELNHASIIDGIRLCKARRFRYRNCDLADLEAKLREADAGGARFKLIATDGVFSMDGFIAPLREICALADRYNAMVMVDDSHAVGFIGPTGRGTPELCGVADRIDLLTGTLGKALGGASGGYASGRKEMIALLRQRSRPYLFSNSLAPVIAAASLVVLDLLDRSDELRARLADNTRFFREGLTAAGLTIRPGTHPIVPVMLGDAVLAQEFAARMLARGIFVVGFFFPVVPLGAARIRVQVSAAHTRDDLERAIAAFTAVADELGCRRRGPG